MEACCGQMRVMGRDHYKGVPETDLPDALIEFHREVGAAALRTETGRFDCLIQYCPWCGAHIGKKRDELPRNFDPFE